VIVDKKFFQLSDELLTQLADVINVAKAVVGLFDSNDAIVADFFLFATFLSFDDPNHATF